jgi:hypothetical protein
MDKIKSFVLSQQGKLKQVILFGAGLGAFNCLTRPDFNLIVYLYIYYIWFMFENKVIKFLNLACSS